MTSLGSNSWLAKADEGSESGIMGTPMGSRYLAANGAGPHVDGELPWGTNRNFPTVVLSENDHRGRETVPHTASARKLF